MNDILVSVIVPIYNVEDYLPKCIDSIICQTYKNIEIILVDDGSPDSCGQICENYKKKDSRIKVIHKENGGLSDARNAGICRAKGSYYVFIDSDDYIHERMIETLVEGVVSTGADIAVCSFKNVKEDEIIDIHSGINTGSYKLISEDIDRLSYFYGDKYTEFTVAWNKIYPASFFKEIKYPKGKIHEDEFTTYKLLELAKKIAYIDVPLYYYVSRSSSIMGEEFSLKRLHRLDAISERMDHYLSLGKYDWYEKNLFLYRIFYVRYYKAVQKQKMDIDILKEYFKNYKKSVLKNILKTNISIKKKLGYIYLALFPDMYIKKK
ncbi:Glycosyltransferase involved in cell wall bisynthesis [Butyrivibrio fibrisolvens]|uniref:Glycosyltransferase involved in cell wall bisynthesis n=1 Tax=Butyrivibrio fibrisolvens TaxID=831 RepID=A0A1H9US81_BUTFI|nr:glycosyltransferase [Butyrivibrio fibrisolvens]SES12355.1 Glycosyltransferase involved in cell wall bisynthesis [Butyrivibrio fibrisolvens]